MNFMKTLVAASVAGAMMVGAVCAQEDSLRPREYGIQFGVLQPGQNNAITDVEGVLVGQVNVHDDKKGAHTGVTAILPHGGNLFKEKVPAGIFLANGFGKMTGYPQVKELGNIETPIVLVNTLNVAAGLDGIIDYTFSFKENGDCRSVNGVVGETNDGGINDIRIFDQRTDDHVCTDITWLNTFNEFTVTVIYHTDDIRLDIFDKCDQFPDPLDRQRWTCLVSLGALDGYQAGVFMDCIPDSIVIK